MSIDVVDFLRPSPYDAVRYYLAKSGRDPISPVSPILNDPAVRLYTSTIVRVTLCYKYWDADWRQIVPAIHKPWTTHLTAYRITLGVLLSRIDTLRATAARGEDNSNVGKLLERLPRISEAVSAPGSSSSFRALPPGDAQALVEACKMDLGKAEAQKGIKYFTDKNLASNPPPGVKLKVVESSQPGRPDSGRAAAHAQLSKTPQPSAVTPTPSAITQPSATTLPSATTTLSSGTTLPNVATQADASGDRACPECQEILPEEIPERNQLFNPERLKAHVIEWHSDYALAVAWRDQQKQVSATTTIWACPSKRCPWANFFNPTDFESHILFNHAHTNEKRIPIKYVYAIARKTWGEAKGYQLGQLEALERRMYLAEDEAFVRVHRELAELEKMVTAQCVATSDKNKAADRACPVGEGMDVDEPVSSPAEASNKVEQVVDHRTC